MQDLERQLYETKQQLEHFRAMNIKGDAARDFVPTTLLEDTLDMPAVDRSPQRILKARIPQDLSRTRAKLQVVGQGLIKAPIVCSSTGNDATSPALTEIPPLPPRHVADILLESYCQGVHRCFPFLHWPTFYQRYVATYEGNNTVAHSRVWIAMLLTVFACGSLFSDSATGIQQGEDFLKQANGLDLWLEDMGTDHIRVEFLKSVFLIEVNRRSAAWATLGSAIRMAQDLGLGVQGGIWSPIDGEMRKRIWYSLYVLDR
jgi:Fungal specific transcription factor domain